MAEQLLRDIGAQQLGQFGNPRKAKARAGPQILEEIRIPGLADIPVIGEALFNQTILVYLMYISVAVVTTFREGSFDETGNVPNLAMNLFAAIGTIASPTSPPVVPS